MKLGQGFKLTLWQQLYGLIWLVFLQIILIIVLPSSDYVIGLHVVIGLGVLGLAQFNSMKMKKTEAPDRLKRIVRSTATLAIAQLVLGLILYLVTFTYTSLGSTVQTVVAFIHVAIALAIITQASSVATAYDMWEEHEYAPATPTKM